MKPLSCIEIFITIELKTGNIAVMVDSVFFDLCMSSYVLVTRVLGAHHIVLNTIYYLLSIAESDSDTAPTLQKGHCTHFQTCQIVTCISTS